MPVSYESGQNVLSLRDYCSLSPVVGLDGGAHALYLSEGRRQRGNVCVWGVGGRGVSRWPGRLFLKMTPEKQ